MKDCIALSKTRSFTNTDHTSSTLVDAQRDEVVCKLELRRGSPIGDLVEVEVHVLQRNDNQITLTMKGQKSALFNPAS